MLSSMDTYMTMIIISTFMYSKTIFFKKIKKRNGGFLWKSCKILNTKNPKDMTFVALKSTYYPASIEHKFS